MGSYWFNLLLVVHILIGCAVIGFVLIQHGKGADMGAAFGGGASGSLFGSSGSANFLSRTTAILAALFFVSSLTLSYLASQTHSNVQRSDSLVVGTEPQQSAPAAVVSAPMAPVSAPAASAPVQELPK